MTEAVTTTDRSPRAPFAGVPVRDLVRDVVAATALVVGLALPWDDAARGSDRLAAVLATVVALLTLAAPYAWRAGLVTAGWAADERRTRLAGAVPLLVVAVWQLAQDAIPGGVQGVGAGLGLALAGALLAAGTTWRYTTVVAAVVLALGAVAALGLAVLESGTAGAAIAITALTTLLVLVVLWLTVRRFERGDASAGVLLVGLGAAVALAAAFFAGTDVSPWVESVHGARFGLLLLPVLAACAAPRVVGQTVTAGAQPQLWAATAVQALGLASILAAYVAVVAAVSLVATGVSVAFVLRIVFGVVIAVVAYLGRRALARDLASGQATAVGAAVVVAVLGLVLVVARAGASTRTNTQEILLTFGIPALVLAVLLVPRSLRDLRGRTLGQPGTEALAVVPPGVAAEAGYGPTAVTPAAGAAQQVPGQVAAAYGVEPSPWDPAAARPTDATTLMDQVMNGSPAAAGEPAWGPPEGATQVLPPVADVPGSRWTVAQALDPATPLADLALIVQEAPHLRPMVAANPSTYPALLDWLGALGDPDVDAALRTRG